jgi:hypothetical protein
VAAVVPAQVAILARAAPRAPEARELVAQRPEGRAPVQDSAFLLMWAKDRPGNSSRPRNQWRFRRTSMESTALEPSSPRRPSGVLSARAETPARPTTGPTTTPTIGRRLLLLPGSRRATATSPASTPRPRGTRSRRRKQRVRRFWQPSRSWTSCLPATTAIPDGVRPVLRRARGQTARVQNVAVRSAPTSSTPIPAILATTTCSTSSQATQTVPHS